jgi:two-component system sensor histidine kinase YesM
MTVTIGICLIIIALVTVGGYSLFLSRSLSQLRYMMKRAELGDLSVMAPSHKNQEINSLYHSFNKMVEEIRGLIEVVHTSKIKEKQMEIKQRESMLASIQSKINPHFLYNTLEVINSHAITEGYMPISRMVIALAKIFRYSVGSPQEIINVQVELDQIQTYLEVQKQRFEELNMEINIEYGTRKQVKALKLLLQPIVENAFIHGYEKHKIEPSYIGVFDELRDDCYVIKVVDKGGGMSAGKVEQFNHIFNEVTINQIVDDYQHPFLDRIGLWNVHSRIVLAFGNPYGLHIAKSDESGTVIEIRFPYE